MVRNSDAGFAAEDDVTALEIVVRVATGDDFFYARFGPLEPLSCS